MMRRGVAEVAVETGRRRLRRCVSVMVMAVGTAAGAQVVDAPALPEAPSSLLAQAAGDSQVAAAIGQQDAQTKDAGKAETQAQAASAQAASAQAASDQRASATLPPCESSGLMGKILWLPGSSHDPCQEQGQLEVLVDAGHVKPITSAQKGELAIRSVLDPFNLLSITAFSGISIAANSHSAYGPGWAGFGRLTGYSLAGDVQGEFLGTYLIPVVTHEDPRYHRMARGPIVRRALHAVVHTYVTQHDDGRLMPNYSVLAGYPIGNVLSNLYVPGIATNGQATARRIAFGIALNPVGDVVAEFLPDVARRIHVRAIFVQQILNKVAQGGTTTPQ